MFRVQIVIIQGTRNYTLVGMIEELLKGIIEHIEWNQCARFLIHDSYSGFFEQRQHGSLAFCEVLARRAVCPNRSQDTAKQVKLIWDKRIDSSKVFPARVEFLFRAFFEIDQISDNCSFFVVKQCQRFFSKRVLLQNALPDDFVYVGRGQGKARIKSALNFREIIALHLCDRIDILLAGDDDPRLAAAGGTKVFRHGLEIEHQFGIVTDILSNLIDKEDNVMIIALFIYVLLHKLRKTFDTDRIRLCCFFAPVTGRFFAHEAHI